MVHNRQLKLIVPTVHCTVPFCIALCSVYLVGLVVVEHVLVFEPDGDWEREKIFAYEVIEIARQDNVAIKLYERPIRYMR